MYQKKATVNTEKQQKKNDKRLFFRLYLLLIDLFWKNELHTHCFDYYPPSFYLTHTSQEVSSIKAETRKQLMAIIADHVKKQEEKGI